jgi:hypothetical protein
MSCKAIILEGARKGQHCTFPPSENSYCGRHQRHYEHEQLTNDGKLPCRFFFRGCNQTVVKTGACIDCKTKVSKKSNPCAHNQCTFKTTGDKYCGKHSRDVYYDEEKEKGIKYCDIPRGCFTLCKDGYNRCETCRDKSATNEATLRKERLDLHNTLEQVSTTTQQLCVNCGKDYEQFMTRYNKPSKLCKACNLVNKNQDAKRSDRERNYKHEHYRNLEQYYKNYITSAAKRGYTMSLSFEDFKTYVLSPCYYCTSFVAEEVNGIDRINNDIGYEKDNCVACCETCNMMKFTLHPLFFINLCKIITGTLKPSQEFYTTWKEYYGRSCGRSYTNYKKNAEERGLPFHITKSEWDTLIYSPCYLCGYQDNKGIGLDRVENTKREYTLENVKPCCGTCNSLKNDMSLETIKDKSTLIDRHWIDTSIFESIPRTVNSIRN